MRPVSSFAGSLALLATLLGCSSPTGSSSAGLRVESSDSHVILTNSTKSPIYTFVGDRNTLALMLWGACNDPATCESVAAGAEVRIPYDDIHGYTAASTEAVVYWWHLKRSGSGFVPGRIREVVLTL